MRSTVVTVLLLAVATRAGAAPAGPTDLVARPLVLARGHFVAEATIEIGLLYSGRPISLAPDAWVGVTDRWTVGVIHSNQSVDRIDAGASFCLRHDDITCVRTYRGSGLDVRYGWLSGHLAVAPRLRVLDRDLGPVKPAVMLGALLRWTHGRYAITSDPYLRLGLANRERGNRDAIMLPVWLALQPTCRWAISLHTGFNSDLAVIRDGWHVPVTLGVRARATAEIDVGVEAGFTSLLGPQNNAKQAAIAASIAWRH